MAAASIVIDLIAKVGGFQTDTARAERSLKSLQKQLGDTRRVSEGFGDSFGNVGRELKSLAAIGAGGFGVGSIIQLADGYTKFTAQLKLATDSATDFNQAYQSVINIANQSQSDVEAIGIFYGRLARFTKDAGIEASALSDITTTVANSLRANGATAKETASTFLQLSQAFGAGRLNGQEFAAVSEAASPLLNQLAKTLTEVGDGTVVTVGQLKDLAAEGKLSLDILVKAFSDKAFVNAVKEQSKEVQTVSSAVTVLKNNFQVFVGEQDKATGSTKALASTILTLGENLETVAKVAFAAISVSIVKYIASQAQLIAQARNTIAIEQAEIKNKIRIAELNVIAAKSNIALAQGIQVQNVSLANNASLTTLAASKKFGLIKAEQELANAQKLATAQVGLLGRGLSLLGGPVGVAVTGIILFGDKLLELGKRILGITPALSELNDEIERQNKLQSSGVKDDINAQNNLEIKALRSKITEYKELRSLIERSLTAGRIDTSNVEEFSRLFTVLGVGGLKNAETALKALDAKILESNKKIVELTSKNVTATPDAPKVDEKFLKNLQEQIVELSKINPLLKQGVELDDASFIAKAKLAGVNDELIVTYLNLKNEQGQIVKQFEEERKILEDLNKIRKEEIPLLELTSKIASQGVDLADAEIIAKLKLKGVNDELIVTYLNAVNVQKQLVESQKEIKDATDEAKKLNEEALTPLEKLTAQYDKLVKLQQNGLTEQGFNQGLKDAVAEFESASSGALQYSTVLDDLNGLYEEANKYGIDVKNISLELTIAYKDLFQQLKDGTIKSDEFNRSSQELLKTFSAQAKEIGRLNSILGQTESAKLQEQIADVNLLWKAYTEGINGAKISLEQFEEGIKVLAENNNKEVKDSANFLDSAFKRAAENAQDAFADFLFDPLKDGIDGFALNFINVLKRVAAEALALQAFKQLGEFFSNLGSGGGFGSSAFNFLGSFFGGGKASGGDVLAGRSYLVGERGPEMFTPRSNGTITPNAQTMNTTQNVSVKNINVLDPTLVGQYLNTDAGEKVVMNVIQRNRSALGF